MEDTFKIISDNGGYITSAQAKAIGRGMYYRVLSLVQEAKLIKIRRGIFALPEAMANTMIDTNAIVPDGVLCMYSAWFHYGLTTQIPDAFYIAIAPKRKIKLPEYPPVELLYWKNEALNLGLTRQEINGYLVNIYDIEKSVCDAIRMRNKIGIDVCREILRNYLQRNGANLIKLMEYGKQLRISTTLNKYLEIQVWQ